MSPIAAYKAFQEANRRKDYEAVKRSFSKASLEMITEEAKKQNKTLDEFVKQQTDRARNDEEVSNEKINGDTATIELKDKDGTSSITLPMVIEDGAWKIAYDRFMKQ
jgi:glycyl-tRNA synthetase (class II)